MGTASSASRTYGRSASASEYTATVLIPIRRAVLITRRAISPRLATSTESSIPPAYWGRQGDGGGGSAARGTAFGGVSRPPGRWRAAGAEPAVSRAAWWHRSGGSRTDRFMITGQNGQIGPKTTHDHGRSPKCLNVRFGQMGYEARFARYAGHGRRITLGREVEGEAVWEGAEEWGRGAGATAG